MTTLKAVKAYYDGKAFVPIEPLDMPKGRVFHLSILQEETTNPKAAEKLASFRQLTHEIHELNKKEPLPPEFDEILE
ncbi:MAG: hypothetical protein FWF85_07110 [Clostridiales bacterium]|nr:hypothetical protein [Clostridiales bacterium]